MRSPGFDEGVRWLVPCCIAGCAEAEAQRGGDSGHEAVHILTRLFTAAHSHTALLLMIGAWEWRRSGFLATFLAFCQPCASSADLPPHVWCWALIRAPHCLFRPCQEQVLFLVVSLWVNASWSVLTVCWRGGVCRVEGRLLRLCGCVCATV